MDVVGMFTLDEIFICLQEPADNEIGHFVSYFVILFVVWEKLL